MAPNCKEKCNVTKANMPRSRIASSVDGTTARRTLTVTNKESVNARRPCNCFSRKEASAPPHVDVQTNPWSVTQDVTPPCASRFKVGVQKAHVFEKCEQGEGGAEMIPLSKDPETGWQDPHQGLI